MQFALLQASPSLPGATRAVAMKAARRMTDRREKGLEKGQPALPEMGRQTSEETNAPEMMALTCQGLDNGGGKIMGMKERDAVAQAREKRKEPKKLPTSSCCGQITPTSEGNRPAPGNDPSMWASSSSWVTHSGRAWTTCMYAWW